MAAITEVAVITVHTAAPVTTPATTPRPAHFRAVHMHTVPKARLGFIKPTTRGPIPTAHTKAPPTDTTHGVIRLCRAVISGPAQVTSPLPTEVQDTYMAPV